MNTMLHTMQDLHQRFVTAAGASRWGYHYYRLQYRLRADPWRYATSQYEQQRYARVLASLPRTHYHQALEIGCAVGVFTARLVERCQSLTAIDFVGEALVRAQWRCREHNNVHFAQMDALQGGLAAYFDLIICGEILYYLGGSEQVAQLAAQCLGWLQQGGHVVLINPWPASQRLHRPFHAQQELRLLFSVDERRVHRPYTIAVFERQAVAAPSSAPCYS